MLPGKEWDLHRPPPENEASARSGRKQYAYFLRKMSTRVVQLQKIHLHTFLPTLPACIYDQFPKSSTCVDVQRAETECTLYCWILEILYCHPKGRRALLRVPSTAGRSVCLCWAKSKPKGPENRQGGCFTSPRQANIGRPAGASKELIRTLSRNATANLEYGERRCWFNTKHQSTKVILDELVTSSPLES